MYWNMGIRQAASAAAVIGFCAAAWYLFHAFDSLFFLESLRPPHQSGVVGADCPEGGPPAWESRAHRPVPVFPWPPPKASAVVKIPRSFFLESSINHALRESEGEILLYDVFNQILVALMNAGYHDFMCYAVPDGFALATRMEAINGNGTPKQDGQRWGSCGDGKPVFMPDSCIKTSPSSEAELFRMIVFVVTPHSFSDTKAVLGQSLEQAWLDRGFNALPEQLCEQPYTDRHICTALVYEFARAGEQQEARLSVPGTLPGKKHLVKSALWASLQQLWTSAPY